MSDRTVIVPPRKIVALWENTVNRVIVGISGELLRLAKSPMNGFTLVDLRQLVAAADSLELPDDTPIKTGKNFVNIGQCEGY